MPVIDPNGLFFGFRMRCLSQTARLYWPYFYCAANSCGRLEIDYERLMSRVFGTFPAPPLSEEEFQSLIAEYHNNWLLYIYTSNGEVWGQFVTSEKFLPRHKDAESRKSPDPGAQFAQWLAQYAQWKDAQSLRRKNGKSSPDNNSAGKCRTPRTFAETCATQRTFAEVCEFAQEGVAPVAPPADTAARKKARLDAGHERFWAKCWVKRDRHRCRAAWPKAVLRVMKERELTAGEAMDFLVDCMAAHRQAVESREDLEWLARMHPTSWLNGARWDDDLGVERKRPMNRAERIRQSIAEVDLSDVQTSY